MAESKESKSKADKSKSVTLKRTVTIKAVVTDKFREYMKFEITAGIQNTKARVDQLDEQLKDQSLAPVVREKMILERDQLSGSLRELAQREAALADLKDGSFFTQGMVDGFVTVNVGDNLYEKLGAMEIVLNDGVVETITPVAPLPPA